MYQINIPAIYTELQVKTMANVTKVLGFGTTLASFAYILAGIFGYIAFTGGTTDEEFKDIFEAQNILRAPYGGIEAEKPPVSIFICLYGILIVVGFASPFCVLPVKDSIEEVRSSKAKLTRNENLFWTAAIVFFSCALSLPFLSVGSVMTILGATTNSAIGFLLPITFYLKMERKTPTFTSMKLGCYFVFVFICISSVIELTTFGLRIASGNGDKN